MLIKEGKASCCSSKHKLGDVLSLSQTQALKQRIKRYAHQMDKRPLVCLRPHCREAGGKPELPGTLCQSLLVEELRRKRWERKKNLKN